MRESRTSGSARGAARKGRPYRDPLSSYLSSLDIAVEYYSVYTMLGSVVLQREVASDECEH
jgi:hypothetical protein